MRMDWSLRASSWDRSLRSRFLRAKTRFSEFLMWWVCSRFISRSIPLDCIFRCMNVSADSKFPLSTLTRIPLHCWSCWFPKLSDSTIWLGRFSRLGECLAIEFIFRVSFGASALLQWCEPERRRWWGKERTVYRNLITIGWKIFPCNATPLFQ